MNKIISFASFYSLKVQQLFWEEKCFYSKYQLNCINKVLRNILTVCTTESQMGSNEHSLNGNISVQVTST